MIKWLKKLLKYTAYLLCGIIVILFLVLLYVNYALKETPENCSELNKSVIKKENITFIDSCWIKQEQQGLWTMYIEGKPYERGVVAGILSKELIQKQEKAFIDQIHRLIPSNTYLSFLKYFIACFNYNLYSYIPEEYKREIYGISKSASDEYNFIGTPYQRLMNYHGAHDLGHLLQNIGFVACSSFGVWDEKSKDGDLIIGRNFDFYVGDDFAKEKIVEFIRPDSGYPHAIITWGGMAGVVSGMNSKGLTVTINAANSEVPFKSATPVSIVARSILQYSSNIEQAIQIASKFKVFVSEQFLIGSAEDNKAIVIEKTPKNQFIFKTTKNYIISTNHFQSNELGNTDSGLFQKDSSASGYRMERIDELINQKENLSYIDISSILRDTAGIKEKSIGLGNEKSINQLIAHHSIIFSPKQRIFWISTSPYQIGKLLAYDLNEVFNNKDPRFSHYIVDSLSINADSSFLNNGYNRYIEFKEIIRKPFPEIGDSHIERIKIINPKSPFTYEFTGDYYCFKNNYKEAISVYQTALNLEIPSSNERNRILKKLYNCKNK